MEIGLGGIKITNDISGRFPDARVYGSYSTWTYYIPVNTEERRINYG